MSREPLVSVSVPYRIDAAHEETSPMLAEPAHPLTCSAFADQQGAQAAAIDLQHLARYTLGDSDLQREILGLFREQLDNSLAKLAEATDVKAWRMAAHTLKGSARGVGAFRVGQAAEAAERAWPGDVGSRPARKVAVALKDLQVAAHEARMFIAAY